MSNKYKKNYQEWHRWFAWHPVKVKITDDIWGWVWLKTIERRWENNYLSGNTPDYWRGYEYWDYRIL